jgi:3-phosphoshikimate 1-carboxyvinyltransferase
MKVTIQPSQLSGMIQAPASKSSMQRACAAALLSDGNSIIHNPGHSNDDKAAIDIIQKLGANIEVQHSELRVESGGINPVSNEINCGESGLSIRMFTPVVALSNREITINGSGSLTTRPMNFFDEILPKLGVKIKSNNGKLPVIVQGPLVPANIEVDGSLSSQFLTGLLMAFSAATSRQIRTFTAGASKDSGSGSISIKVKNLKSKPYIDLTLDVMKKFGMKLPENKNYEEFVFHHIPAPGSRLPTHNYTVEDDWSGGAFLLVAGAIAGPITVRGLDLSSAQADRAIIDAMMNAHAGIAMEAKGIKVHPGGLRGFDFDATDCPDLFPPLVALAAYCNGKTKIKGVNRLKHKESNRAATLQEEFGKMGVKIGLENDVMIIDGGSSVKGSKVHSHHDHRIAMACAVAALQADGKTEIEAAEAVNKSYPDFYWDLKKLSADVSLGNKIKFHE